VAKGGARADGCPSTPQTLTLAGPLMDSPSREGPNRLAAFTY
jgi:hypothetical protein